MASVGGMHGVSSCENERCRRANASSGDRKGRHQEKSAATTSMLLAAMASSLSGLKMYLVRSLSRQSFTISSLHHNSLDP